MVLGITKVRIVVYIHGDTSWFLDHRESCGAAIARVASRTSPGDGRDIATHCDLSQPTVTRISYVQVTECVNNELFRLVEKSAALRLEFIHAERFWKTKNYYIKHLDQRFSFVDCSSFVLMKELKVRMGLTQDQDFGAAGFEALL